MTHTVNPQAIARSVIGNILDGAPPNGTKPSDLGPYDECYAEMLRAYEAGGTDAARRVFLRYAEVDADIAALRASDPDTRRRWSAAELLRAEFEAPRWIVENLLPAGLSVLAGRPKLGKSWFALQIVVAAGSSGMVLDRPASASRALYLALEDSPRRIQDRLRRQHAPADIRVDFRFEIQPLGEGGAADILVEIDKNGYDLIVIDTISRALGRADQMSQGDMNVVIGSLQRIAVDRDAAILLIDHHRKSASAAIEGDVVDDVMGATGKTGVADALLGIYRKRGERGATLKVTGRDLDDQELAIEFDRDLFCWQFAGLAGAVRRESVQGAIITALKELGGVATTSKLARWLNRAPSNLSPELAELVTQGLVIRERRIGREVPYRLCDDLNTTKDINE